MQIWADTHDDTLNLRRLIAGSSEGFYASACRKKAPGENSKTI